jgi:hypothetical protein
MERLTEQERRGINETAAYAANLIQATPKGLLVATACVSMDIWKGGDDPSPEEVDDFVWSLNLRELRQLKERVQTLIVSEMHLARDQVKH